MTNLNNNASISARNTFPLDNTVQESTESDYRSGTSEPKSGEGNALTQEEKLVGKTLKKNVQLTAEELAAVNTKKGLLQLLLTKNVNVKKALVKLRYEQELEKLQIELVKLQRSIQIEGRRVGIIFEGRDAAGKGGSIRRFIEHLNPRSARVVALPKPTDLQKGQWYFQRYVEQLPNPGEIVFFDRSWYNRAVVEPVMGFCNEKQYRIFMQQVPEFEHMLYEDNLELVKFWFSISKDVQAERFESRRDDPLKQWKISPVDDKAQENWDLYTKYKNEMFSKTHTSYSPWIIVKANDKKKARLESMRYVLSALEFEGKESAGISLTPDPNIVGRYYRSRKTVD
ncbi:MAG: polyphosphate kinase 2 [Prochloraceae cyanobacterium]|nr:polyphosphate kinase 2 [Prochloraceae cyanobacterium]